LLISNNKQQQNPSSRFKHPSPPQRFVLPQVIEQLSDIQPKLRPQTFKVPQLPVLAIVTSRPRAPEQKFVPQKLIHINSLNNRIHEPVLSSSTILIPIHTSLKREDQSATIVKNIGGISLSANDAFLECCKEKNVDTKCESRCNFDILDRRVLTAMFIGSDPCPRNNGRSLLSCAAQDSDHTNCCRANGVQHTAAGDKCLEFCQMTPESNFQADVSMLPCWSVLKEIKQCFRLSLIEKRNIKEA
ncbi:DB module family protein, partial [Wuchereria bancrofti]